MRKICKNHSNKFHYSKYKNNNEIFKMSTSKLYKSYFVDLITTFTMKYLMQQMFSWKLSTR